TKFTQAQQPDQQVLAYNVPDSESGLTIAEDADIRREIGEDVEVTIQPAGTFEWIRSDSPGRELRWALLTGLAIVLMLEQVLSHRLSYQPGEDLARQARRGGSRPKRAA